MNLITSITNITFPYITNKKLLDINSLFGKGTWIDLPQIKASWVSFGNIVSVTTETTPTLFGSVITNSLIKNFTTESSNLQYNEELSFDIKPNNVENKVKTMRSAYCEFKSPYFIVDKGTKTISGLTSGSTGVILVGNLGQSETFQFSFTGDVSSISANTADFNFNIYKYSEQYESFLKPESISETIDNGIYENSLNFSINLNLGGYADNEYIIKGGYTYDNCTPGAKLLGTKTNTLSFLNPTIGYVDFNPLTDWYFTYTMSALTPQVFSLISLADSGSILKVESLPVQLPGITGVTYYTSVAPSGSYLVFVNGVGLQKNVEYISGLDSFTMLIPLLSTDIITVAYVANGQNSIPLLDNESYVVPNTIPNISTAAEAENLAIGGQKVVYNTSTNRYEYWLDSETNANVTLFRNGIQQSTAEYIVSSSNKRRIILFFTPTSKDILEIFYASLLAPVQNIENKSVRIIFSVAVPPTKVNGNFVINFYDKTDIYLTTPLFSASTDYIIGQNVYNVTVPVPVIYGLGQEFLWQITNTKNFNLNFGSGTITTFAKSSVYNAFISTNENLNY